MPFTTTYFGHSIEIEPFEWGYLAHILEPDSNTHLIAASASAFKALEDAFELIDDAVVRADRRADERGGGVTARPRRAR